MDENKVGAVQSKGKIVYLEICRIIAVFCIMYQHTGGRGADAWMYTDSNWVYSLSLVGRIISGIGVPMFLMISGSLLLTKKESWKNVYGKRIPRITGALIIFSVTRYFYLCIAENHNGSVGDFFHRFYTQEIFLPYWFLYEYLGILLLLPFLKKMVQNMTEQEKRVLFVLILGWNILNDISIICLGNGFIINLHFHNPISYFILGYLMENCQILKKSNRRGLWFCIGQAVLVTGCTYIWVSSQHEMESVGSLIMLLTISAYYMIRYIGEKSIWNNVVLRRLILWCGSNVFGIYLIEDYLRNGTSVIWEKQSCNLFSASFNTARGQAMLIRSNPSPTAPKIAPLSNHNFASWTIRCSSFSSESPSARQSSQIR